MTYTPPNTPSPAINDLIRHLAHHLDKVFGHQSCTSWTCDNVQIKLTWDGVIKLTDALRRAEANTTGASVSDLTFQLEAAKAQVTAETRRRELAEARYDGLVNGLGALGRAGH